MYFESPKAWFIIYIKAYLNLRISSIPCSHPVPNQVKWHKTPFPWIVVSFSGLFSAFSLNQKVFTIIWTQMSFHADGWIFYHNYGNLKKDMRSRISSHQKRILSWKFIREEFCLLLRFQPQVLPRLPQRNPLSSLLAPDNPTRIQQSLLVY